MLSLRQCLAATETEMRRKLEAHQRAFRTSLLVDVIDGDPDEGQAAIDEMEANHEQVIASTLARLRLELPTWLAEATP